MTLPIINVPTYKVDIPSTKESIKFRPFRVNEEKILLLALEMSEENPEAMMDAVKQIIENCTFGEIKLKGLALFDLEYIFLRIRAKSVGEVAKVKLLAEDDGETYVEVDVPLEKIEVHFDKTHKNNIKLSDNIWVIMKYPQYEDLEGAGTQDGGNMISITHCGQSQYYHSVSAMGIRIFQTSPTHIALSTADAWLFHWHYAGGTGFDNHYDSWTSVDNYCSVRLRMWK